MKLNLARKAGLSIAGILAAAIPVVLGVMNAPVFRAQAQSISKFEVASIRPNNSGDVRTSMMPYPDGRLTVENNSLKQLVRSAFGLRDFQIKGGPKWLDVDRFDIVAKAEGPATREQHMQMLRSLLVERFKLSFHRETKQLPVFYLIAAKKGERGPDISVHGPGAGSLFPILGPPGRFKGTDATMQQLAASLSGTSGDRVVLDKTGMTGAYDFTLVWTPERLVLPPGVPPEALANAPNPPPADGPSLSTALREQLGLKLEPGRGPVEIITIDSAERPSEN
jgi:bla regulator protein blaR1